MLLSNENLEAIAPIILLYKKYKIVTGTAAPIRPIVRPSTKKGASTNPSVAPT